eukprot:4994001-Prymnesium_polylepis.1
MRSKKGLGGEAVSVSSRRGRKRPHHVLMHLDAHEAAIELRRQPRSRPPLVHHGLEVGFRRVESFAALVAKPLLHLLGGRVEGAHVHRLAVRKLTRRASAGEEQRPGHAR